MKLLIADDDPVSRHLLRSHVAAWGHEVATAENGARAWELFAAGEYPIVISDWLMPEVDGLELLRRVRAAPHPAYVYFILVTSLAAKEDVVQGMEAGADDFVTKPFDREELRVRVRAGERIIRLEQTLEEQNRALRDTQAALYQSEKLASLGQLAAGVAHEINNPLAYVLNNLAVLRRDGPAALALLDDYRSCRDRLAAAAPERAADLARREGEIDLAFLRANLVPLLDKTLAGLHRVRGIVTNLRDFARLDEAAFKEVNLNEAVTSTLEILSHEVRTRELNVQTCFQELPPILGHPGKLNQVLLNLLVNAAQACGKGGRIAVRTRAETDAVVVEVEDDGCGIPTENLPHLFEPFFTTKPVGQGTGLGLSVSYAIVRDHGGTIAVESTAGRGSTFRVRLPLRPPVAATPSEECRCPTRASTPS
jgi:two-component system NtrC family sensor kinase